MLLAKLILWFFLPLYSEEQNKKEEKGKGDNV